MIKIVYILLFAVFSATSFADTAVIPVQYRNPSDLLPALLPFIEKGTQISTFENKLMVQGSSANIQTIQTMVKDLDKPATQYLISFSNGSDEPSDIASQSGDATYSTQRDADYQVNRLRVDNGKVAFLSTGETIPLVTEQIGEASRFKGSLGEEGNLGQISGQYGGYGKSVAYRAVNDGMYVKPTAVGDKVQIEILSQNDQPVRNQSSDSSPVYTNLKSETKVTVPFGKWVYLGGNRDPNESANRDTYQTRTHEQSQKNLWIKVEKVSDE